MALLRDILERQHQLLTTDEPSHIDLLAIGLDEPQRARLYEVLGEGEIVASVSNFGLVGVKESGYAGIWWVTHTDEEGAVLSEFLEISYCPEVLIADKDTVADGHNALKARLFELEMGRRRM